MQDDTAANLDLATTCLYVHNFARMVEDPAGTIIGFISPQTAPDSSQDG